jgi:hypothetical protein
MASGPLTLNQDQIAERGARRGGSTWPGAPGEPGHRRHRRSFRCWNELECVITAASAAGDLEKSLEGNPLSGHVSSSADSALAEVWATPP